MKQLNVKTTFTYIQSAVKTGQRLAPLKQQSAVL